MNLSSLFIKKPIATILLAFGLSCAGILAFDLLPVAPLPQIDFPTIMVQAQLPGGSPEVMATSVAAPLERQIGRIAGVTQLTSTSTLGQASITVQFDLSRNIDGAARDIQAAINASLSQLPTNLTNNPTYRKVNPADAPIMIIALTSDKYTPGQMYDVASTILQQKILRIEGVGQVGVGGGSLPAVRVEINPTALNKYGIGLNQLAATINNANVKGAKGQLIHDDSVSEISNNDQMHKASEYAPLIISYFNNQPVRLSDVAHVFDSVADVHTAGLANGKPAVLLVLFKQPGANVIKTVDHVKQILPQLGASISKDIKLNILLDRTTSIRTSLHDVELTLLIAMCLVIFVTYLFLGSFRAMIIPGIAVPLSLLGTFAVMKLLNYSLDNLSLMALTISTGFVVDDAVVVLENISRHIAMGKKPLQAAFDGSKEIGFTVLSISISLIAVFIPIFLMSGIVGRLFREFVVTLSVAILISLVVSLTLTPMMCSQMLHENEGEKSNYFMRFMEKVRSRYAKGLHWALFHPRVMLILTFATVLLTTSLFVVIPRGFFPLQNTDRIAGSLRADQNISFQAMKKKLIQFVSEIRNDPAVANVGAFIGSGPGNNTANAGSMFITLKPTQNNSPTTPQVIQRLRSKLSLITGATLYMQAAQDLTIGGRQTAAQFQYTITSDNLNDLATWTPRIMEQLTKIHGITDLNNDQLNHGLQTYVNVDHDTAMRFGITPEQIDQVLYHAFGQSQISVMYMPMNQYYVVMNVAQKYWQYPAVLDEIYVKSSVGDEVPLSSFASFKTGSTLLSVNHLGQAPAATFSFNLSPGVSLGGVVKQITAAIKKMNLPPTMRGTFQGTAQAFQESFANERYLIMTAILAVYIVLGMLYESLIHPITILSTLPSAGVGALLALLLFKADLSIIALIGMILLIGIVKKNAIMMIDFALEVERLENKSPREAIYEAALLRFRPIMMTTMAAILGAMPLVIGFGVGSELRRPLGITIVGGLIMSQLLTLYTTPVIYLAMDNAGTRFRNFMKRFKLQGAYGHS
ncbi:multidrug transporter subunit MdtC [Legionella qingyii]|uniref:Multidrug transporter subunit MdtC n=1 Tax=Legionella qingyii TaxID=2184757 RepID=A0A317U383_9GAMM|nr:efflux RND transporter permease subunit [Legionella qingyii]PWY54982.1 multidrug transporter subunit MdtC [Legionella qingyii]RUR21021.1 multidrug transporter subunit MdtC [Legionella qingyii]